MFNESDGWMVEENLRGFRDSASLARFREIFPEQTPRKPVTKAGDYRSPFVAAVLDLNSHGVDFREAQWAAGQATCRLEPSATAAEVLALAQNILKAREAA
jgi:hypothetical protein